MLEDNFTMTAVSSQKFSCIHSLRCASQFTKTHISLLFDFNSRISKFFGIFLVFLIASSFYVQFCQQKVRNELIINYQHAPLHIVSDRYVSFGLDTSMVSNGIDKLKLGSDRLRNLTTALSPAYIRLGGTLSDRLIFVGGDEGRTLFEGYSNAQKFLPYFALDSESWVAINNFCKFTNLSLVFSLNVLLRNDEGWDPRNAIDIINMSKRHNYKIDWQLGNEPNSFPHVFNISVTAKQLAKDFSTLKNILNEHGYNQSLLIGPDTTRPQVKRPSCLKYMVDFLSYGSDTINVISWHQYYLNSRTATLADFWNPDTLDLLKIQIGTMLLNTTKYRKQQSMWLSETSSSYGGGADGLSNTFSSSPLWLDKLGLSAKNGISVVVRQSLMGGFYSLLSPDLDPLPDWWISWMYKKLVSSKVIACGMQKLKTPRMYCGCATKEYCLKANNCVVVYGVNLSLKPAEIFLKGSAIEKSGYDIDEYLITAQSRTAVDIYVNDVKLKYKYELPTLTPRMMTMTKGITLPPYSMGFWIIKNTSMNICG